MYYYHIIYNLNDITSSSTVRYKNNNNNKINYKIYSFQMKNRAQTVEMFVLYHTIVESFFFLFFRFFIK